ncbi:ARC15 [[Candida] subhashii]|uniref:Actin-related protein 2/3 complex subunit 5 n=1 Tax=[Candida] subhashii TaxID=561895 RepID=A0A8J5QMD9_9ASCO|nr:ARC15 [[Candida] subhashii]KAG7662962.1 ARC15 [[Candida] subhashii]
MSFQEDWRKIDIDAFETENHLSPEDLIPDSIPATPQSTIESVSQQIRNQLSTGQFQDALALALDSAPYVSTPETKSLHARTVFETLCSIRNNNSLNDLDQFIHGLNSEQQETLIKYLYKSMSEEYGQKQGGLLLSWFEKAVEIGGLGPIARYLTDRRTV